MEPRTLIGWIVLGLICGVAARLLVPGRDAMGWVTTIALGIVGSLVGGVIGYLAHLGTQPYEPGGWVLSVIGAVIALLAWYGLSGRRTLI
jgi:uncharacterized membrane protein YeaQ/YmgE (transglycosylase-associated protein family)